MHMQSASTLTDNTSSFSLAHFCTCSSCCWILYLRFLDLALILFLDLDLELLLDLLIKLVLDLHSHLLCKWTCYTCRLVVQISALCVLQLWKHKHALQYIAHHITTTNVRTYLHYLKSSLLILRAQRTVQHNIAITPHDTCVCSEIAPLSSYERWFAPLTFSSVFSNSTDDCSITLTFLPWRLAYYERVLLTWLEFSNTTLSCVNSNTTLTFVARTLTLLFLCWNYLLLALNSSTTFT